MGVKKSVYLVGMIGTALILLLGLNCLSGIIHGVALVFAGIFIILLHITIICIRIAEEDEAKGINKK